MTQAQECEGKYTEDTVFRRRTIVASATLWLVNGLKKIKSLEFLTSRSRSLCQAALLWLLAERQSPQHCRTFTTRSNSSPRQVVCRRMNCSGSKLFRKTLESRILQLQGDDGGETAA